LTLAQRRRAELAAAIAGAKFYLADVRAGALRCAADLSRIQTTPGRPGTWADSFR
jgi:hypothetical protein